MALPDHERRCPLAGAVPNIAPTDIPVARDDLEQVARRVVLEALSGASRNWWLKRAETFERARPVPGEFAGNATREELHRRWLELTAIADACRAKASVCAPEDATADLDTVWAEEAA